MRIFSTAATLLVVAGPLSAQASRTALTPGTYALTNVHVVPMTRDTVLRNATILVRDGRITAVGAADRVRIPNGTRRIDGQGGYVLPGFADMHTHLNADDRVADSLGKYEFAVMLANGITTARLMIGAPKHFEWQREIEAGRLVGPQLWIATPQFAGRKDVNTMAVTTPEEARAAVDSVAGKGYDFLKITNDITLPVYDAIMAQAKLRGMRVDGHVNRDVGLRHVIESGQHTQHLDGWPEAVLADSAPRLSITQMGLYQLRNWESMDHLDDRKIAPLAGMMARSGLWSTPTLALFNIYFAQGETEEEIRSRPDWRLIPSGFRTAVMNARNRFWSEANLRVRTEARRKRYVEFRAKATKALSDSGAKLLAGSDSPDFLMSAGYSLHRELVALSEAGLTPYQVLTTATRNPAEFLGGSKEWGTIEAGKRADLVLVSGNPLADIRNAGKVQGVAIGGKWLAKADLDAMLDLMAAKMNPGQ